MKAVMMSIQPRWCELIASGKKTVEVRKTRPKLETPFKCYIYCTQGKGYNDILWCSGVIGKMSDKSNGKVIGEFVCDNISEIFVVCDVHDELPSRPCEYWLDWESDIDDVPKEACMSAREIMSYLGKQYNGYTWHISDLVIYDKPKNLSEFYRLGKPLICDGRNCEICNHFKYMQVNSDEWDYDCDCQHQLENRITLKRPPQSWCYVEELR